MKGGIASRLTLIFSLLVLAAAAAVGFLVFWGAREALIDASTNRLEHTVEMAEVRLSASREALREDIRYLAETPPVQGIVRASGGPLISRRDGRLDRRTNLSDREWSAQMIENFDVFLQNRPSFLRILFVGEAGREVVRVERTADGASRRVPWEERQDLAEAAFYRAALALSPGSVHFSEIEPQEIHGETAPVLYVSTPVYDARGTVYGALVIALDFRHVLRTLPPLAAEGTSLYLAVSNGDFLLPEDSTRRARLPDAFPNLAPWWEALRAGATAEPSVETEAEVLSYFEHVPFYDEATSQHLVLGATSPRATILDGVTQVRNRSVFITVLFALWGIALALVVSQYLTRPIRQITRAAAHVGDPAADADDAPLELPVRRKDEIGLLARTFDTMARKIQAQFEELEERAHRQRIILETSAEGILVTDADGRIETFNRAAEQMFGYRADAVLGHNVRMLLAGTPATPEGDGQAPPPWHLTGNGREIVGRRQDGTTFPLSLALSTFTLGGEQKYAGFVQDITRRKQHEQTLREAKLTAEAANRAKSAFLANMSHEIRTPLTGIIGFASLLARQVQGKHRKYAQLIESSGERLKETLNSVLDLAKLEAQRVEMELEPLVLAEEVRAVVPLFLNQAQQRDLELELRVEPAAARVRARLDRGGLSSILHNLIGNALKFTDEGGVLVVVDADAESVSVSVQDSGVGIDPDFMPHLFDEFRQESSGFSRTHEGSGLGLSITRRLVVLMDGTIAVESEKGRGSIFTVRFPRAERAEVMPAPAPHSPPAVLLQGLRKTRVLLVEDNENTRFLIENLLEEDCLVTAVGSAEDALLRAFNSEFDLVLMDINLGQGPNGADVLRELRAMPAYRDVPVVAITAYALPGDRERFLEMGFTDYLAKPFHADELLALTARL
ncbi:MAG: ATP-binding protein [Rhodothermales bacterium]|nr:ATP-binding protein [Rhodothermales bacterium]